MIHPSWGGDIATWRTGVTRTVDKGNTWTMISGEKLGGFPYDISVPSEQVAYILCYKKLIKYKM
jgi:hypothetical protein